MYTLMPTIASKTSSSSGKTHLSKLSTSVGTLSKSYGLYAIATQRKLQAAMSSIEALKKSCRGIYKRNHYPKKIQTNVKRF
jgi:hypothetical protein